ncbi:glycosyltransferase family 9 protein [Neptuniibacter sp. QD57_21]|uniref:glycosyltransferase family 9 protein n=1 Tax=Neptuniibacter sp. QD57_21 TaxID=3398213 RepID=UPI0039F4E390
MTTSVLITRHDKIGDFVVALPMFQCLKAVRPELRLVALVSKINLSLAQQLPYIDEVIEYQPDNLGATLAAVKKAKCSVSISAFIDSQLGFLLWRAGIPKRIGPATKLAQIWFNCRVKQRRSQVKKTEFAYNLDLLKAFDSQIETGIQAPLFGFAKADSIRALEAFNAQYQLENDRPIVAFHPGSGGSTDGNLTLQDYIRLAQAVIQQEKYRVVFTFGPDDESLIAETDAVLGGQAVLHRSQGSVYDFALLLSNFSLFVSTSTGPMHLAAGSNLKTISFFGDVKVASPARWASVNQPENQHNFTVPQDYSDELYSEIEEELLQLTEQV